MIIGISVKQNKNIIDGGDPRLYRIPQAVEYLGGVITANTMRQWIWRRQIEVVRVGRAVCISRTALDRLIEAGTTPALEHKYQPLLHSEDARQEKRLASRDSCEESGVTG